MKKIVKLISITIFSMLFISIAEARMLTYVIIGDSIMSGVANSTMNGPDGQAKELAAIAKTMTSTDKKEIDSENQNDEPIKEENEIK